MCFHRQSKFSLRPAVNFIENMKTLKLFSAIIFLAIVPSLCEATDFEKEMSEFSAKLDSLEVADDGGKAFKGLFSDQVVVTEVLIGVPPDSAKTICISVDKYISDLKESRLHNQKVSIHRSITAAGFSADKSSGFLTVKYTREISKAASPKEEKMSFVTKQ